MSAILNEDWTADVVGRMHRCRITNEQLARECGYSATYLSVVLNGKKELSDKGKESTKDTIFKALERIESRILSAGKAEADDSNDSQNPNE